MTDDTAVAAVTLAGAWTFQALGFEPCELCLKERFPDIRRVIAHAEPLDAQSHAL